MYWNSIKNNAPVEYKDKECNNTNNDHRTYIQKHAQEDDRGKPKPKNNRKTTRVKNHYQRNFPRRNDEQTRNNIDTTLREPTVEDYWN